MKEKYQRIKKVVEKILSSSAHDMDHTMRVYNLCPKLIEHRQEVNLDILNTASLLHDIARIIEDKDYTGKTDHAILGAQMAEDILIDLGYPEEVDGIKHCITSHRARGENKPQTIEAKILFDSDKLDVIGAIGIARCFSIAGEFNQKFYSEIPLDEYIKENLEGGRSNGKILDVSKHTPDIEFETKFKHIPDRLYTKKARQIAKSRMQFMEQFFKELKKEVLLGIN